MRVALLVVDVQVDFCPGGALAVKDGDRIVPGLNAAIESFVKSGLPILFTRDWHPPDHVSFKGRGGPWPPHCVQGTAGAGFHPELQVPLGAVVISKGDHPSKEAYSGFQGTDLARRLKKLRIDEVVIGGLTTDYCVKETALDAMRAGFKVRVLEDCVKAVEVKQGDGVRALAQIEKAGAEIITSSAVIREMASTQQ